ncbi:hypothetical protein AaE_015640 [Aphanomyces astaci]|uniref:Uncharacterized protein n=1 Tax=Aphanomyces astaci TaxID=112090 RepID=A0A6A4Z1Y0_APHAT|nr:hypothetical protein AaE_015640 [Aphanomyces astaci]
MASVLLEHGVNVNAQNKVGSTALHVACKQGFPDMLRLLIDADADFGLLDASQRAPFEFASWALVVDTIVDPLRQQVAALETSEQESQRAHERLEEETCRLQLAAHAAEMDVQDVWSQQHEEWMAFREKSRLQDDRRSHLVLTKRTLKQLDDNVRAQRAISNELHAQLEESLSRYRYTIAQADAAKDLLDRQIECVAQMHRVKDEHTAEYNDKLGVVDAMVQCPNDEDVQVWGAYMACCLTAACRIRNVYSLQDNVDTSESNTMSWRLVNQNIFPALKDAIERFPLCAILQDHAINTVRQICLAQPSAIDQCMQHKFVENVQAAARRFRDNLAFVSVCVGALRAMLLPTASDPRSATQIKHMAKFSSDHHEYLIELFVRARTAEPMPTPFVVEDLCCVLFVLAKYNCRQLFLDRDCIGLDTALFLLVQSSPPSRRPTEVMARSLLGIVSLLSIPAGMFVFVLAPEQTPLPSCYTTFGLAKVTPVIETYANNPDIVLWGIRLLRNLATRDAVARDQVNRSGIEHILSSLAKHRGAPALRVSILELIYVAFTTNYTRLNQVDELSTMVLNCVTLLLLDHEDHHAVQVLALQNLVTASQHASNLEHLMASKQVIGPCVLSLLQLAAARAFPATADRDTIIVWGLRFMVTMGQYGT